MKERILWTDRARGLGILLTYSVHFFHMEFGGGNLLVQLLSMSVLPPFYFASGYFCRGSFEGKRWLKHHGFTLLLPYLTASLGFWMIQFLQGDSGLRDRFLGIFLQLPETPWEGGRWFIPSFFLAKLIFDFHASRYGDRFPKLWLCCAGCAAAAWVYTLMGGPRLPWNVEAALFAQLFFAAGFGWKRYGMEEKFTALPTGKKVLSVCVFCTAGLLLAVLNQRLYGNNIDYHTRELNDFFSAYGASLCGLFLVIRMSMKKNRLLEYVGRNSLLYCLYGSLVSVITNPLIPALGIHHWAWRFAVGIVCFVLVVIPVSLVLNRWFPWAAGKQRKTQKTGS